MREVSDASDPREAIFFHDYDGPAEVREELRAAGFVAAEARPDQGDERRFAGADAPLDAYVVQGTSSRDV